MAKHWVTLEIMQDAIRLASRYWRWPCEEYRIMSLLAETKRAAYARHVQRIGAFAVSACIAVFADGSAFAQSSGHIPAFVSNPSTWGWVRIRADGRNAI